MAAPVPRRCNAPARQAYTETAAVSRLKPMRRRRLNRHARRRPDRGAVGGSAATITRPLGPRSRHAPGSWLMVLAGVLPGGLGDGLGEGIERQRAVGAPLDERGGVHRRRLTGGRPLALRQLASILPNNMKHLAPLARGFSCLRARSSREWMSRRCDTPPPCSR
jgi:hypothetical protein